MPLFHTPKSWSECADALRAGNIVMVRHIAVNPDDGWKPTHLTAQDFDRWDREGGADGLLTIYRIVSVAPENRFTLTDEAWDEFTTIIDKPLTDEQREALTNLLNTKTIFD